MNIFLWCFFFTHSVSSIPSQSFQRRRRQRLRRRARKPKCDSKESQQKLHEWKMVRFNFPNALILKKEKYYSYYIITFCLFPLHFSTQHFNIHFISVVLFSQQCSVSLYLSMAQIRFSLSRSPSVFAAFVMTGKLNFVVNTRAKVKITLSMKMTMVRLFPPFHPQFVEPTLHSAIAFRLVCVYMYLFNFRDELKWRIRPQNSFPRTLSNAKLQTVRTLFAPHNAYA